MDLPGPPDYLAPDGSEVRLLCRGRRGGLAHFRLEPGRVSAAVVHRSVEELWYVVVGHGEMWRSGPGGGEDVVALGPGTSVVLPVGTAFQFRTLGDEPLAVVAATMPPWPGAAEAREVASHWPPR